MPDPSAPQTPASGSAEPPSTPTPKLRPEGVLPPHHAPGEVKLSRDLGLWDATMLGVGALMGGGVFVLLGIGAGVAGPALLLAFFLNGLITLPTLMVYAELGSASTDTGGGYLWIKQALKQPWGFLGGWMSWFSHAIACAVYALASSFFLTWIIKYIQNTPEWPYAIAEHTFIQAAAATFGLIFVALNYFGVKVSVRAENTIAYVVLFAVLIFLGFGIWEVTQQQELVRANFIDFFPNGTSSVLLAMGITFIAFEGYEIISQTGEEIKNPKKTIPRAIGLSLIIVWPIMLLTTIVALGLFPFIPSWVPLGNLGPLALVEAAQYVMPYGSLVIVACAMLLQLVALNATIYSSSRVSYAMGRDANLPAAFGRIHKKRRTPHVAVLVSGLIIVAMAVALPIEHVAVAADIQFLLLFLLVNLAYLRLRHDIPADRFGYRAPFFPVLPIVAIAAQSLLAVYLYTYSPLAWGVVGGIVIAGLLLYALVFHPRELRREKTVQEEAPVIVEPWSKRGHRILVPVYTPGSAKGLALAARDIAVGLDAEIVLLNMVLLPTSTPLEAGLQMTEQGRGAMRAALDAIGNDAPVRAITRIGHQAALTVRSTAEELEADLILIAWRGQGAVDRGVGWDLSGLAENPPCDLALVKIVDTPPPQHILQATHVGANAPLALKLAGAIGKARGATVTVLAVTRGDRPDPGLEERMKESVAEQVAPTVRTSTEIVVSSKLVAPILERARGHDLLVLGASGEAWRSVLFGTRPEQIAAGFPGSVLLVKSRGSRSLRLARRIARGARFVRGILRRD